MWVALVEIVGPEGNDSKDLVLAESDRWPAQDMIYHDAECSTDMQRRKRNRKATKEKVSMK
jgi:hypothetical protein